MLVMKNFKAPDRSNVFLKLAIVSLAPRDPSCVEENGSLDDDTKLGGGGVASVAAFYRLTGTYQSARN